MLPYRYSPLRKHVGAESIRLLRLLPNDDENATIACQLVDYFLPHSDTGPHLYEALSYVWGHPRKKHSITLDNCSFGVTANLHAALTRLRNRYIERVVWIDAICVNQGDLKERGYQIGCMARIYGKAKCVIVWLGSPAAGSDLAFDAIGCAANSSLPPPPITARLRTNVCTLIERPWFRRIWVLQEVAAARQILITCGAAQMDGYAFCVGLQRLNLPYEGFQESQRLIRSVTFLISQAIFRSRSLTWWSGRTSLEVSPLTELIDMYHAHEATERHDKIYALLGMSSDDLTVAGLLPDYGVPWSNVFMNLLLHVFGKNLPIEILGDGDAAVVRTKGYIISRVSSVSPSISWSDLQEVEVSFWNETKHSTDTVLLAFRISAKPLLKGDLICFLENISTPMIVRACKDFFGIIKLAALVDNADLAPASDDCDSHSRRENRYSDWLEAIKLIKNRQRNFLLIWDWKMYARAFRHWEYTNLKTNSHGVQTESALKAERLSNSALILADSGNFEDSGDIAERKERIKDAIDFCESTLGKEHPSTLACMDAQGLMQMHDGDLTEAESTLIRVIQARIRVQGVNHSDTLSSMNTLEDLALANERSSDRLVGERVRPILDVLRKHGDKLSEKDILFFAGSLDKKAMLFLLETRGHEFKITENILKAALSNCPRSLEITTLLLDHRKEEIKITEEILIATAENQMACSVMRLFLDRRGDEFRITPPMLNGAARNEQGHDMTRLLLERRGDEVHITEETIRIAAGNNRDGARIIELLLEMRGDEVHITEEMVRTAAGNQLNGEKIIELLLERRGDEVHITEEVVRTAVGNAHNGARIIELLLERRGDEVHITEEVVRIAAGNRYNGLRIIKLLLNERKSEIEITEAVVRAVSTNERSTEGSLIMSLLFNRLKVAPKVLDVVLRVMPEEWRDRGMWDLPQYFEVQRNNGTGRRKRRRDA